MESVQIDPLAVLVAAVAHFVLGGLWYSPVLFAKPFMAAVGKTEEELQAKPSPLLFLRAFLGGLVQVAGLAILLSWIGEDLGAAEGALVGGLVALVIHGAADYVNALFESRHRTLTWLGVGYTTVALAVSGAILSAMS